MKAVVTTGHGGYDKLVYGDVDVPHPGPDEVLIQVLAAGINNTDINTRLGWYSPSVTEGTDDLTAAQARGPIADGGWNGASPFPLIQGTDCCGRVAVSWAPLIMPRCWASAFWCGRVCGPRDRQPRHGLDGVQLRWCLRAVREGSCRGGVSHRQ